jgi:hypothetical protein
MIQGAISREESLSVNTVLQSLETTLLVWLFLLQLFVAHNKIKRFIAQWGANLQMKNCSEHSAFCLFFDFAAGDQNQCLVHARPGLHH